MDTKVIAMTIAFAAVTVVLNPSFLGTEVPSFLPGFAFQIWEIPVVAAFLLIGPKHGVAIALLNAAVLQAVFPSAPFIHPLGNLIALLSTLIGVYLAHKLTGQIGLQAKALYGSKLVIFSTALGMLFRVAIMTPFLCILLHYSSDIFVGLNLPARAMFTEPKLPHPTNLRKVRTHEE